MKSDEYEKDKTRTQYHCICEDKRTILYIFSLKNFRKKSLKIPLFMCYKFQIENNGFIFF